MLPPSHPNPNLLSPFPLNPIRDIRNDLWTQHLLTSLQVNQTYGQLMHCAYYHPFSSLDLGYPTPPFLSTADHYFEWWLKFDPNKVLGTILFSVHLSFYSDIPFNIQVTNPIFQYPSIIICWWDIPTALPGQVCTWVNELGETLPIEEDIWLFKHQLFDFINKFWKLVFPYDH